MVKSTGDPQNGTTDPGVSEGSQPPVPGAADAGETSTGGQGAVAVMAPTGPGSGGRAAATPPPDHDPSLSESNQHVVDKGSPAATDQCKAPASPNTQPNNTLVKQPPQVCKENQPPSAATTTAVPNSNGASKPNPSSKPGGRGRGGHVGRGQGHQSEEITYYKDNTLGITYRPGGEQPVFFPCLSAVHCRVLKR